MFDFIVQRVNDAMKPPESAKQASGLQFGVLDIYGFEIFDRNGFEQLCINYINERLQQIFISLTLQNEQQEYKDEGIQWTPIEFFNNKVVVDLIEAKRPPGIMSVLDDVCFTMHAVSEGADETFVQKLDAAVSGNRHYEGRGRQFIIHHYAGSVNYTCDGFVEANKDTLTKDLVLLMQTSSRPYLKGLFPENVDEQDKKRPPTASIKIRAQSQQLVDTLMRCVPSYVRCIKPNENKRPREFDNQRVLHQVVYLNLKENVKIRRAGFCARYPFDKFLRRYGIITKQTYPTFNGDPRQGINIIMQAVQMAPDQFQLGRSKVFIKAPESLFLCEEARERKYDQYARVIQRAYRRWKARKQFVELREQSVAIVFGKKERKRFSLSREFIGDYIGYHDDPVLRTLVGNQERVIYADRVVKYDRRYKTEERELLVSDKSVMIMGVDKAPDGPHKGKMVKMIKRKVALNAVSGVSLSTRSDDFVVLHAPEYDSVFSTPFKTEFVTVLTDQYRKVTGRNLQLNFSDQISYTVKKTFWSRAGSQSMIFIPDPAAVKPIIKPGDKAEIRIAPGLPPDSRPRALTWEGAISAAKDQRRGGGAAAPRPVVAAAGIPPAPAMANYPVNYPAPSNGPAPRPPMGIPPPPPPIPGGSGPNQWANVPPPPPLPNGYGAPVAPSAPPMNYGVPPAPPMGMPRPPAQASYVPPPPSVSPPPAPAPIPVNAVAQADLAAIAAKKKAPPPPPPKKKGTKAKALYDYQAQEADELTFNAEDIIWVTKKLGGYSRADGVFFLAKQN